MRRRAGRVLAAAALCAATSACVYVPKTVIRYDDECEIGFNHMVLTSEQVSLMVSPCSGTSCAEMAIAMLVVTPVSAIVSGSIVLAGNTVYWMQKQGRCEDAQTASRS